MLVFPVNEDGLVVFVDIFVDEPRGNTKQVVDQLQRNGREHFMTKGLVTRNASIRKKPVGASPMTSGKPS